LENNLEVYCGSCFSIKALTKISAEAGCFTSKKPIPVQQLQTQNGEQASLSWFVWEFESDCTVCGDLLKEGAPSAQGMPESAMIMTDIMIFNNFTIAKILMFLLNQCLKSKL